MYLRDFFFKVSVHLILLLLFISMMPLVLLPRYTPITVTMSKTKQLYIICQYTLLFLNRGEIQKWSYWLGFNIHNLYRYIRLRLWLEELIAIINFCSKCDLVFKSFVVRFSSLDLSSWQANKGVWPIDGIVCLCIKSVEEIEFKSEQQIYVYE